MVWHSKKRRYVLNMQDICKGKKYSQEPWATIKRINPILTQQEIGHLKKVLKSDKIDIKVRQISALKRFYIKDVDIKIYYCGNLILDYPKGCLGADYIDSDRGTTHKVGDGQTLNLAQYIKAYIDTPIQNILGLPSGPLGIYEILMAMDERISIKRLWNIVFMIKSPEARKILKIREQKQVRSR